MPTAPRGWGIGYPAAQGCRGAAPYPLPINDTKPSFVAASAVVYWCGRREPPSSSVGGTGEAPQEPEPRLLGQGPISSLTKAAMQYWRATGNPKLQYLRAARALLTALHPSASPRPPDPLPCPPKHGAAEYLGRSLAGDGAAEQRARCQLKARCSSQHRPCPYWRRERSYKSSLPAGPAPPRPTQTRRECICSWQGMCTDTRTKRTYLHVPVQLN